MRTPGFVIAWSVWSRHRKGFLVAAVTLAALAVACPILASMMPAGAMALISVVPLVGIFAFVLNALLFAEDAGSLSSCYPRHMLTLPVRTGTLAFWPMLFASAGAGILWVATALLIDQPVGYRLPVVIPALALAGLMAWAQALAWLPIRIFWLREVVNVILVAALGALGALPIWLLHTGNGSEGLAAGILIVYIAAAYVAAWAAVVSDRRGRVWRFWPARTTPARTAGPVAAARQRRPFHSPFRAQLAYEWNCHGLMLNAFVAVMLFVIWGTLLVRQGHGTPQWLALILAIIPIVVVSTIAATGTGFGRFRPLSNHSGGFMCSETFIATRPMTTGRLVAAKYTMAAMSVCLNWTLAVAGTTGWLFLSDNLDNATVLARNFFERYPGGKGYAVIALACILLPALSWRLLTGPLVPVLTGRRWFADSAVWLYMSLLAGLGGCGFWLEKSHPDQVGRLYPAIPFLVAGIATLKGAAVVAGFRLTLQRGLMSCPNVVSLLGMWLVLTGCGIAMAILLGPVTLVQESWPILALGVASFVPLARFPLANLALDWNRHR